LECRSNDGDWTGASPSLSFYGHAVDLRNGEGALFKRCDAAVRRGIRKAEAAGLKIEFDHSADAMRIFYSLHCGTRRRHRLPPQPFRFFDSIRRHVLEQNHGFVATARLGQRLVAAAVFFHFEQEAVYKFGASDYAAQNFRPNNLVMWAAIRRYVELGFKRLHLGRTSLTNDGLRRFKLGFGAQEEEIEYCKYDFKRSRFVTDIDRAASWVNNVFGCLPVALLRLTGRVLYPHLS
jgi:lipid II:glycine glycyltransferase (peptidoglycan interpeptide bridge formation enzyme)